jgi:hypothetical protein
MTRPRSADSTESLDQALDTQACDRITEAFGRIFPVGVMVEVAD